MLVASSSPVKFSRIVFPIVKIRAKFDWSCTTKTFSISRCESLETGLFYRKLSSRSEEIRQVYSTEFLLNTATIREVKLDCNWPLLLKIVWWEKHRITRHYNAELQTTTQTLRATKYSIESTYSDLPCDLKVNRGKLALINRPWKCKKGKDRRSPLVHSRKLDEHDDFTRAVSHRYCDRGQR